MIVSFNVFYPPRIFCTRDNPFSDSTKQNKSFFSYRCKRNQFLLKIECVLKRLQEAPFCVTYCMLRRCKFTLQFDSVLRCFNCIFLKFNVFRRSTILKLIQAVNKDCTSYMIISFLRHVLTAIYFSHDV